MGILVKENIIPKTGKRKAYVAMYPITNPESSKGFVLVPKVGSSTMSEVLEHYNGWQKSPIVSKNCKLFGLVRHPFNRWVSGTTEHWNPILTLNNNDLQSLIDTDFETLLDESFKDRHTQPQAWNFDKYPQTIQFKFENIHNLIKELIGRSTAIHARNHSTMGGLQNSIYKIVKEKALPHMKLILETYDEDLRLWNDAF